MTKFKVGDRVRCIRGSTLHNICEGVVYEVAACDYDDRIKIVGGDGNWWKNVRFELVPPVDPPSAPATDPSPQDLSNFWQVGKTYRTTLEGVTVSVISINKIYVHGARSTVNEDSCIWHKDSGQFVSAEGNPEFPHLLPIEVEQPEPAPSKSQQIRDEAAEALAKVEAKRVDPVNHTPQYTQGVIECIDAIRAALTDEEWRGYCKGNALKYIWRERHKGGDESVAKAAWYLERMKGGA